MSKFEYKSISQKEYENHAINFILRTGAKNIHQWEREAVSLMKSNSTKAYERYAKKANIQILDNEEGLPPEQCLAYELRLRLAVVAIIMTVSCKTPRELEAFQPQLFIFCQKMYEDRKP